MHKSGWLARQSLVCWADDTRQLRRLFLLFMSVDEKDSCSSLSCNECTWHGMIYNHDVGFKLRTLKWYQHWKLEVRCFVIQPVISLCPAETKWRRRSVIYTCLRFSQLPYKVYPQNSSCRPFHSQNLFILSSYSRVFLSLMYHPFKT